jgi:hypothetical protein
MKKSFTLLTSLIFVLALLPRITYAQDTIEGSCGDGYIDTAIGCVPWQNQSALIAFFLRWAIGIGGGIAFLLILYAGFMGMTSAGNPERIKAAQELLISAISGLLLLIFSIFILRFIGVDLLRIPGFEG